MADEEFDRAAQAIRVTCGAGEAEQEPEPTFA